MTASSHAAEADEVSSVPAVHSDSPPSPHQTDMLIDRHHSNEELWFIQFNAKLIEAMRNKDKAKRS